MLHKQKDSSHAYIQKKKEKKIMIKKDEKC